MFLKDRRGSVAVIAALTMPLAIAGAGFGVETGYDFYVQVKLQQAADAAAFGGGIEKRRGSSSDVVTSAATAAAQQNGYLATTDTLSVTSPNANSVQVALTRTQPRIFSAIFVNTPLTIGANATASYASTDSACILALDPTASGAANFAGSSVATLNGCVVMANSISSSAITVQGSAQLTTPCLYAVGGVSVTSGAHLTSCSSAKTGLSPIGDPYATVSAPSNWTSLPCLTPSQHMTPGRYCGGNNFHGGVTFDPGQYYFDGGKWATNANASMTGSGVTLFFMNSANIDINGSSHVSLSAPTSGAYSGMLLVGDRGNSNTGNNINGDATSSMTGAIYFPKQDVSYIGNFSGTNGCTQVVAKTVSWSGNATLGINCTAYGLQTVAVGGVSLVG